MQNMTFSFIRSPGLGGDKGEPAPKNFPQCLASAVAKGGQVTNVRLISSSRSESSAATGMRSMNEPIRLHGDWPAY